MGLGGSGRRGGIGKDGNGEEVVMGTGGRAIVAGGGLGRARLIEVVPEGGERNVALAAELGLSQAASAEIVEDGVPA